MTDGFLLGSNRQVKCEDEKISECLQRMQTLMIVSIVSPNLSAIDIMTCFAQSYRIVYVCVCFFYLLSF